MGFVSLFIRKKAVQIPKPDVAVYSKAVPLASAEEAVKQKRLSSRLAAGAVNMGDLCMEGGLQVIGTHQGRLDITGEMGIVWISESGMVTGDIEAPQVYVQGKVKGSIHADMVIIEGRGGVEGQIRANRVLLRNAKEIDMSARILSKETVLGPSSAAILPINVATA